MSPDAPPGPPPSGGFARVLKIVAGVSAVLSLIFAIRQATIYVTDHRDRQRRVAEALAMDWLEHAASSQGLALGALGDTVAPVLARGTLDARGARRGDLLAHLG